jgi:hypothetical protein
MGMIPYFLSILTNGQIWVSNRVDHVPTGGTVLQQFRILDGAAAQLVCTLTGSGNASASALAVAPATKSGKAEGNEIH